MMPIMHLRGWRHIIMVVMTAMETADRQNRQKTEILRIWIPIKSYFHST